VRAVRYCEVCAEPDCHVDRTIPEPAPFTAVRADDEVWFNIPMTCNWNWYSPEADGLYSWIDLLHITHPDVPEPASVEDAAWCCGECRALWPWFHPTTAAATWGPGCPSCMARCPECGVLAWPSVHHPSQDAPEETVWWWTGCVAILGQPDVQGRVLDPDGRWTLRGPAVPFLDYMSSRAGGKTETIGAVRTLRRDGDQLIAGGSVRDQGIADRMFAGELRPALEIFDLTLDDLSHITSGSVAAVGVTERRAWPGGALWFTPATVAEAAHA
jgi:hypothetical protein